MQDFNPYEAPKTDLLIPREIGEVGVWRDGALLVMSKDAELPDRCIKCDAPAEGWRLKRKLSWHPPAYYLLILLHVVIYVIVALIIRNKATLYIPLCPEHRRKRRRSIAIAWALCLTGIGAFVTGISGQGRMQDTITPFLLAGGALTFLAGLICAIPASQTVTPKKIDKQYVWLKKVSPELLAGLPSWYA